jgi:Flp pilus assembly protein TadD
MPSPTPFSLTLPPHLRLAVLALVTAAAFALPCAAQTTAPAARAAAATPSAPAASGAPAKADDPSLSREPVEYSEAARKAYAQGMKDARALLAQKKYDEAITKLDLLAKERPREPQARFLKGVALTDQAKVDAAIGTYRELVADFPEMPEPHNNLAVLYSRKGDLALARDELLLAVQTAPDYAIAHENLGDVYARLAAEQYDQAATLDKRSKSAAAKLKLVRDIATVAP